MREIEFRGIQIYSKEWIYGDLLNHNEQTLICTHSKENIEDNYDENVIIETIGQYTGLKDKSDKKIFEGDACIANGTTIIKLKDNSKARMYISPTIKDEFKAVKESGIFICEWNNSFSCFQFTSKTHSINTDVNEREFEIIGNIHQDKHLLK